MASGHVNRVNRPNTWLHRPMLQNVKKALANSEPSTHGAQNGHGAMSDLSLLTSSKQTFRRNAATSVFDPSATSALQCCSAAQRSQQC
jgi:hypothetical protein